MSDVNFQGCVNLLHRPHHRLMQSVYVLTVLDCELGYLKYFDIRGALAVDLVVLGPRRWWNVGEGFLWCKNHLLKE
jgi:hypothetical protein